jgi:LmbE family N-acetylglucosaminyl deacetylase
MEPIADSEIKRILFVTAHPDDLDFGAGGTIAQWTAKGIEVFYCICTNGDQGGEDPSVPREEMPKIRQREQRDAAKALGVPSENIEFLNHRDGWLVPTIELRKEIVRVIRKVKPDRMVIQSPERNWDRLPASHPDHMAAGEAAIQAVYPDARNAFAFEDLLKNEKLEPWRVREVWVMSHKEPDHFVDVTDTFDKKIAALNAHVSQTAHNTEMPKMVREWGERNATAQGLPEGRVAEVFKIVNTD